MQNYAPLAGLHELVGFGSKASADAGRSLPFPVITLTSPADLELLPLGREMARVSRRILNGRYQQLFGLERKLASFDIVHSAETYHGYSDQVASCKSEYGYKIVTTVWENIPFNKDTRINRSIREKVMRDTDRFLAVTERAALALKLEGAAVEKISVLPMGVDLERFRPRARPDFLLDKFGLTESEVIILFAARLTREKGIYELLYSLKSLLNENRTDLPPFRCLVIGSGPEEISVHSLLENLQLRGIVELVGTVPYNEMHDFYNLADIFVLASRPGPVWQEQFGMVLVESMASGNAIIATRSGSIPEVVGEAGILVNAGDVITLKEALHELLVNSKQRQCLGNLALRRAEARFNAEDVAHGIMQIYSSLA